MASFKDALGRKWQIDIDVGAIKRVRDLTGFELLSIVEQDGKPLERLRDDVVLLVNVLYAICEPQANSCGPWWRKLLRLPCGITDEEFGRGLRGDCISRAWELIIGGLAHFFPEARRRMLLAAAIGAEMRIQIDERTKQSLLGIVPPQKSGGSCSIWRVLSGCRPGHTPGANSR
jgi:hypothetical protein